MAPNPRRALPAAAAALTVGLALSACTSDAADPDTGGSAGTGGELVWGIASEPSCFDPHFHSLVSDRAVLRNIVDSLVFQEEDGTFSGWLAESWDISADGTTYTFQIKDGVTFTDGATLDAAAVAANLDYVRDPSHGSTYATLLSSVEGITVPDASTLVLQLSQPDTSLLASLSSVALGIISPEHLDEGDALCDPSSALAGSGPFLVDSYTRGDRVTLVRNDDYSSAPASAGHQGPAYLDSVVYTFLAEDSVRIGALQSGQVDAVSGVPALQVDTIEADPGLAYEDGPRTSSTFGFVINGDTANAPWDDVRLRQAVRDGFDADAIVQSVYQGHVDRAWSWVGADSPEFDESLVGAWGDDVDAANDLLDEAGWTERDDQGYRTKDGRRLTLDVTYDADSVRDQRDTLIEAVQDQLATNLGVELALTTPPWTEVSAAIADGTWSVYPATFGKSDYANGIIGTWGGYFYAAATGWQPTDAVASAQTALTATDDATFTEAAHAFQQDLVLDDAVFVPLTESTFQIAYSTAVEGLGFDASSGLPGSVYDVRIG